ncbi:unnamed protein product [Chondrus crispus]|uniref:Amine oxidase domain-containing protein n=1 Tax=Chondrus crispus TaxID=2769 RepID=R7QG37_CHOCR|nr:unnamed protein product [Chondrus crispus]CDF37024.1 unnamed protein product [Chondrus crispus]|eukprot:XP_005716843.1 unnamed protein product [Chondrus crispus]
MPPASPAFLPVSAPPIAFSAAHPSALRKTFLLPPRSSRKPFLLSPHRLPNSPLVTASATDAATEDEHWDAVIIGSGFGGLSCAAALTAYGFRTLVLESHYAAGGVAHGFQAKTTAGVFHFDTGPSFFCGLSTPGSLCPVKHALDAVDERVHCVSYDRFCIDDVRRGTVEVCTDEAVTLASVERIAGNAARRELARFYAEMRAMHAAMDVPAIALRGDWRVAPVVLRRWAGSLARLAPYVASIKRPVRVVMDRVGVRDGFVKQLLDTEAFLLSGLKTEQTITAEIAFMVGERAKPGAIEYPVGGARAVVDALVRGVTRKGGEVRLRAHVEEILVERGTAVGVRTRKKKRIFAKHVFSNASLWDTVQHLLPEGAVPDAYRAQAMGTPTVESFMHAHLGIPSGGLGDVIGHHAVILDSRRDITARGNTVMISIPTVWSEGLAPEGWHVVHAYTLEPYDGWEALAKDRAAYGDAKKKAAEPLLAAVRHVIPDLDERLQAEGAVMKLGSPVTHARFTRRYRGTYGAAIDAGEAEFEWPGDVPVERLKRCSDSAFPGIGVPSSAAAGLIAANEVVGIQEHNRLVDKVFPK